MEMSTLYVACSVLASLMKILLVLIEYLSCIRSRKGYS